MVDPCIDYCIHDTKICRGRFNLGDRGNTGLMLSCSLMMEEGKQAIRELAGGEDIEYFNGSDCFDPILWRYRNGTKRSTKHVKS